MNTHNLKDNWVVFIFLLVMLAVYYYKLFLLAYCYFESEFFTLPNETITAIYENLAAGDNLKDRVSALIMPLLVVFSATVYGGKMTKKTGILSAYFLILIGISEYLIIQLRGDEITSSLKFSGIQPSVLLKYLISIQDSIITFFGVVLGLSGVNTIQEKVKDSEKKGEK